MQPVRRHEVGGGEETEGGRTIPNDLPPWAAVYQQVQRWIKAGVFEEIVHGLQEILRIAAGREADPTAVVIDSRTLQSTPESGHRGAYDGVKRKKGSKVYIAVYIAVHIAVDTLGHLLARWFAMSAQHALDDLGGGYGCGGAGLPE